MRRGFIPIRHRYWNMEFHHELTTIDPAGRFSSWLTQRPAKPVGKLFKFHRPPAQPNIRRQMITEATTPAKSASSPTATAWRVRRTATDPK